MNKALEALGRRWVALGLGWLPRMRGWRDGLSMTVLQNASADPGAMPTLWAEYRPAFGFTVVGEGLPGLFGNALMGVEQARWLWTGKAVPRGACPLWPKGLEASHPTIPDFSDPATLGCLIAQAIAHLDRIDAAHGVTSARRERIGAALHEWACGSMTAQGVAETVIEMMEIR